MVGSRNSALETFLNTLDHCASSLYSWATDAESDSKLRRVRLAVADQVKQVQDKVLELKPLFLRVDPDRLTEASGRIFGTFELLELDNLKSLAGTSEVIEWVQHGLFNGLESLSRLMPARGVQEFADLSDRAEYLTSVLNDAFDEQTFDQMMKQREISMDDVFGEIKRLRESARRADILSRNVDKLRREVDQRTAALNDAHLRVASISREAEEARQKFEAVRAQQEVLNENTSKEALIEHFGTFNTKHESSAKAYFWWGIFVLVAVATFAAVYAYKHSLETSDWAAVVWKVAVVGGGSAIGTYLLRQSKYHRHLAVWSDTVQVQLQTFSPYIQQIAEESSKDQLRMEFARRVFGGEPGNSDSSQESAAETSSMAELSTLIANVAKLQAPSAGKNAER